MPRMLRTLLGTLLGTLPAHGIVLLIAGLALGACAPQISRQIEALPRTDASELRIVLMPLDVELFELSAGGLMEPKADWTSAARNHLIESIRKVQAENNLHLIEYEKVSIAPDIADSLDQIQKLHGAVGQAILVHHYLPGQALPSKNGRFDWSLGPQVQPLRTTTDAHYALFVYVRDSYSSAGRTALIITAALLGVAVQGGAQLGFASLVDLDTGAVVWFGRLVRGSGDLRTGPAAEETARALLTGIPK